MHKDVTISVDEGNYIVCTKYNNTTATEVELPAYAFIDGVSYNTIIDNPISYSGVYRSKTNLTSIKIDKGVITGGKLLFII